MSEIKFYRLDKDVEYNDSPLRIPAGTIVVTAIAHAEAMNALQARLAQCERDRDDALHAAQGMSNDLTTVGQERDAALERVRELEKGLQFIMFHIEAPQDSDIPADQYIPTLSEAVVCRNEIQRLLALRAGMA